MTRALLLGRVSTADKGQNAENQIAPLREVARRLGWDVAGELPLALSAWDAKEARQVWAAVLDRLRDTQADLLAVWATDRLYREDAPGVFEKIAHLEKHLGIRYYSLQEPFLCTGEDERQRQLLLFLFAWLANWESRRRSERLRAAASARRNRAGDQGRAAWGRGKMPTASDLAEIVRLRASGASLRAIAGRVGLSLGAIHKAVHPAPDEHGAADARTDRPSRGGGDEHA